MQAPPSLCNYCEHRAKKINGITGQPETRCDAYPTGIPMKYMLGIDTHTEPVGDEASPVVFTVAEPLRAAYESAVEAGYVPAT